MAERLRAWRGTIIKQNSSGFTFELDLLKIGCQQLAFKVPDSTHGVPLITQKCLMSPSVWIQTVKYRNGSSKFSTWTSLPTLNRRDKLQGGVERNYVSKNDYPFSQLKEEELEEEFVRGSGPGGQSVNQTANCVVLKHLPTGIVVKCHETRSLQQNRRRARERLQERVDLHLNGNNSFLALNQEEASRRRHEKKKKNKFRLKLKKAFKEREGID